MAVSFGMLFGSPLLLVFPFCRPVCWFADTGAQVYALVDEMFLAGEIQETSHTKVRGRLEMLTSVD